MTKKPELLLHSCCAPCSTSVLERLLDDYKITVFFYNPNITDVEEYDKRKTAQVQFLHYYNRGSQKEHIDLIEGDYDTNCFYEAIGGMEGEPEGGRRCTECFRFRLERTAKVAESLGFNTFGTTLSVSPHKNYTEIRKIGIDLAGKSGLTFIEDDFKKKAGFLRSTQLSKEYGLYRQTYCGCEFSIRNK